VPCTLADSSNEEKAAMFSRLRARLQRTKETALKLALLGTSRVWPVLGISRVLDVAARLGSLPRQRTQEHVLVAAHDDVLRVLGDHEAFAVCDYARKMSVIGTFVLGRSFTGEYRREIAALRAAMPPGDIDRIRDIAARHAAGVVLAAGGARRLEVGRHLARPVLLGVVAEYFGLPDTAEPNESIFDWFDKVSTYIFTPDVLQGPEVPLEAHSAGRKIKQHVEGHVRDLMAEQPIGPPASVLARLLADRSMSGLDVGRVGDTIAGTVAGTLIPAFQEFVQVVDVLLDLRAERVQDIQTIARSGREDLLLPYVVEAARFSPRPPLLVRQCVRRTSVGGRQIDPGTVVFALPITAAFDWKVARWPWRFRPGRPPGAYPIFGHGQHHCVGASPERPIAQTVMTQMALRLLGLPGLRRSRGPTGRAGLSGNRLLVEWS
jgi:cytochrome P450